MWKELEPRGMEIAGFIPQFLDERNPNKAVKQLGDNYVHGGGWQPFQGFKMRGISLSYPGDPDMHPVAEGHLRDETVFIYEHGWVAVVQKDGSFEVARMD